MRKLMTAVLLTALVATVASSPLWAKTYSFRLSQASSINGTQLTPGAYKLELNGNNEALIYRNGKMLTKATVEVKPRTNGSTRNSVLRNADGAITEIRLKKQVVVFVR